jgi:hypothetical protein
MSALPLDHVEELPSLRPVVSAEPVPVLVPELVDPNVPLLSELVDEVPVVEEDESLPPIPAPTLAVATPGTPPLTDALASQLSECPEVSELLVPVAEELPVDDPLLTDSELPEEELSLWAELSV